MSHRHAASRRGKLTGSVATLPLTVAPAAEPAKAAELDGELVAVLEEGRPALAAWRDAPAATFTAHIGPKPWDTPLTAAAQLPARTPEGLRAKAETVADWLALGDRRSGLPHWCRNGEEQVAWLLLRDQLPAARPSPAPALPAELTQSDAELVAACERHATLLAAVNDPASGELHNDNPLGVEYGQTLDAIGDAEPQSMAGWLAKARAAKREARGLDGHDQPDGSVAAGWAWDLVNDMLPLRRGAAA